MTPTTEHECINAEKLESKPWKGGCYAHYMKAVCEERTDAAIEHFQNWIAADLKELDGDTESDYAKFILQGHKHIRTALILLKNAQDNRSTNLTPSDIADLRNFACQLCGKYKTAHLGSCDGCRWKLKGE